MATEFPKTLPPHSSTQETQWRPFTNTAKFTSIPPTNAFLGRIKVEIPDTAKEKNPCSFLEIFKSFARNNKKVDGFMKCRVDDSNTPHLEIESGEFGASFPVSSATVTRRYYNDDKPAPDADLEIEANGVKHAWFASYDRFSICKISTTHSWGGKIYKLITTI